MFIYGRPLASYVRAISRLPSLFLHMYRVVTIFSEPFTFLYHYIQRTSPPFGVVYLRGGYRIYVSSHPHDIITIFVIFVRRDYGAVTFTNAVVDLGANIGVFSLYAALHKAPAVFAYEPTKESFHLLKTNIDANNFGHIIFPFKLAIASSENQDLSFSVKASPYNRASTSTSDSQVEIVKTTTLATAIKSVTQSSAVVVKIDIEGAEYDVIWNDQNIEWSRVTRIVMEYHQGRVGEIISFLASKGLCCSRHDAPHSTLWFGRSL